MAASAASVMDRSLSTSSAQRNPVPRKGVERECNMDGILSPAAFILRDSRERLRREFNKGATLRRMARNYGVKVREMEILLREVVA
jgi:hypothetical protein